MVTDPEADEAGVEPTTSPCEAGLLAGSLLVGKHDSADEDPLVSVELTRLPWIPQLPRVNVALCPSPFCSSAVGVAVNR